MEKLNNANEKFQKTQVLKLELEEAILKLNRHLHSGYENNDLRKAESIFLNFFKKQTSVIKSCYLMRLKNRDVKLVLSKDSFVEHIRFIDLAYESYQGLTHTINDLNEACLILDYDSLKERTNLLDKFLQKADKDIFYLNDFKLTSNG